MNIKTQVLTADNDDLFCSDYTLQNDADSVWITVNNLSVYIKRNDEGVSVDIFGRGTEAEDSIAGCWALFNEGEVEEKCGAQICCDDPNCPDRVDAGVEY